MGGIGTGVVWPLAAPMLALALAAVACSPDRGPREHLPDAPPSPPATVAPTRVGTPGGSEPPPPPPVLPAFEGTIRQAGLGAPPEGADACSRSTRNGLVAFRAAAYTVAESHLRTALERCGATLDVLFPLGLTQLSRGRYIGAMSYLQPALERADSTSADEIRWYLGIAHHRTVALAEAYRHWDTVCAGDSQFSAMACETLQALRAHDTRLRPQATAGKPRD